MPAEFRNGIGVTIGPSVSERKKPSAIILRYVSLVIISCIVVSEKQAVAQEPPANIQMLVAEDNSQMDHWQTQVEQIRVRDYNIPEFRLARTSCLFINLKFFF